MRIVAIDGYGDILEGIDPELISKEKALEISKYSPSIYKCLSDKLKCDTDILDNIIYNPYHIPRELFKDKFATQYFLNNWNNNPNSWAVIGTNCLEDFFIIVKPDVNKQEYILYPRGVCKTEFSDDFLSPKNPDMYTPEEEAKIVADKLSEVFMCWLSDFSKQVK